MVQCIRASEMMPRRDSMPHSNKAVLVAALSNINFVTLYNILLQNKLKPFASNNLYIDVVVRETWRLQLGDKLSTNH